MQRTIATLLILVLTLGGCGAVRDSRLNPFNWFGGARSGPPTGSETNPLIPERAGGGMIITRRQDLPYLGQPIQQITGLVVERTPSGAIIRIEALAARQGTYDVRVVPDAGPVDENRAVDGVLSYTVLAVPNADFPPGGPVQTRTVNAARSVTNLELDGVRSIRVSGATNALTTNR